jgi:hypothetical protein
MPGSIYAKGSTSAGAGTLRGSQPGAGLALTERAPSRQTRRYKQDAKGQKSEIVVAILENRNILIPIAGTEAQQAASAHFETHQTVLTRLTGI